MTETAVAKPWLRFYGTVPHTIDYPEIGLYEALADSVSDRPDWTAVDFLGSTLTYRELLEAVHRLSRTR